MLWFKPEINDKKVNWRFDGFMSSLSKDMKLTWFVKVYIIFDNDAMKTSFFFIIYKKLQIQQNNLLTFQLTACNSLRLSQNVS